MAYATFRIPHTIIHGDDALTHLSKLEGKRATIVTGGNSMRKFGFLDEAKAQLEKGGMEVQIIDGVEPDPSRLVSKAALKWPNSNRIGLLP